MSKLLALVGRKVANELVRVDPLLAADVAVALRCEHTELLRAAQELEEHSVKWEGDLPARTKLEADRMRRRAADLADLAVFCEDAAAG